jgi:hypothetical protein
MTLQVRKRDGRLQVGLYTTAGYKMLHVHTLVLLAFVGPRPDGMECCHNDGNPANNSLSNLRWDTPESNTADSVRHGSVVVLPGELNSNHKVTATTVKAIRADHTAGIGYRRLGQKYGLCKTHVRHIVKHKWWKHIA